MYFIFPDAFDHLEGFMTKQTTVTDINKKYFLRTYVPNITLL